MTDKKTRIHALELGPMENFIYVIEDTATGQAAVVDPAWDADAIKQLLRQNNLTLTDILLTHSHHDHINAVDAMLDDNDAQIHLTHDEMTFWGNRHIRPALHHGGDVLKLGDTEIGVMHTPGHTPGSACYRIGDEVITGDTLFVFGCGRCDLAGGDPEQMYKTLGKMKDELPASSIIRPGHNYAVTPSCTMEDELAGNPFLQIDDRDQFVRFRSYIHSQLRQSPYEAVDREQTAAWLAQD